MLDGSRRSPVRQIVKSVLFLLSPLLATAALAQPFVSPAEITSVLERSPFSTRAAAAMSLARDGNGFVAAWSAGAAPLRVYAARLNASMKPISPIREFEPLLGAAYDANYPHIAPIDGGYAIVWLERERIMQPRAANVVLRRLSASFEPSPAMSLGPVRDAGLARIVGGDADALTVLVQGNVVTIDRFGGSTLAPINDWDVEDAVTRGAPIAVTTRQFAPPPPFFSGGSVGSWNLKMQFDRSTFNGSSTNEVSGPSIGFGGGMYLVAWLDNVAKIAGQVNAVRIDTQGRLLDLFFRPLSLGSFAGNVRDTRPSIAWDGERFLIAWQSAHDIAGATLTPDGHVQTFTLVATAADERDPIVVGVIPGRFGLAYEVRVDEQHRQLNFRYVDFKAFRQRPSR